MRYATLDIDLDFFAMNPPQPGLDACHNCRRRRLKCDRSLPHCLKCLNRGQECLGYQRLFRWEQGVASRGKMVGKTFEKTTKSQAMYNTSSPQSPSHTGISSQQVSSGNTRATSLWCLADPLIQDMNSTSRKYLFYFVSNVCKDLVLYDTPKHNLFLRLIPLVHRHPVLLQIIIANSALHMSNTCQICSVSDTTAFPIPHCTRLLASAFASSSASQRLEPYENALAARQQALLLLKIDLANIGSVNIDVTLAVVLLFIEFELIDSGRDNWRYHVNGARTLIERLGGSNISAQVAMSPLRSCLVSNLLIFDILGSMLTCSSSPIPNNAFSSGALSLLKDAEGNHCSSFPAILLQLIQSAAQLSQPDHSSSTLYPAIASRQQELLFLLYTAQSFDPLSWATDLQSRSPGTDLLHRTHIAFAHRAGVCIYLSRVLLSLYPATQLCHDPESHVADIITHLSSIPPDSALFTATTWPAFIAGVETNDNARQGWVARRFLELWEVESWGMIKGALGVLEGIWTRKRSRMVVNGQSAFPMDKRKEGNWIGELRKRGVDWLIL